MENSSYGAAVAERVEAPFLEEPCLDDPSSGQTRLDPILERLHTLPLKDCDVSVSAMSIHLCMLSFSCSTTVENAGTCFWIASTRGLGKNGYVV